MRTVRRIYFYSISLISLLVAVWGVIGLLRTILNQQIDGGIADLLAGGLSQLLVAVPIFILHWLIAQREAAKDEEERAGQVRALFHYSARLAVILPVAQNFLALFNRLLLDLFDLQSFQALIGGGQTYSDNLAAIAVNLLVWLYLNQVLKSDWVIFPRENDLHAVRRLFRVVWMLYTLLLTLGGAGVLLQYLFWAPVHSLPFEVSHPINGLALTITGLPLWLNAWLSVKATRVQPEDRKSVLRLVSIYLLALTGVITVLAAGATLLTGLVSFATGDGRSPANLVNDSATPLSIALVFGVVWAFFQRELEIEFSLLADQSLIEGLKRIYRYLLSLLGLAAAFAGMQQLFSFLVHFTLEQVQNLEAFRPVLSLGLGLLLIALPLWVTHWNKAQADARREDDRGDHARRSPVRKGYLYLVLFLTVVGGMVTAGQVFYLTISRLLGNENPSYLVDVFNWLQSFLLLLVLLLYHLQVLRQDGRMLQRALTELHAAFPVLLLTAGKNGMMAEIQRRLAAQLPELPVETREIQASPYTPPGLNYQALLLDANVLIQPPGWLPAYLAAFSGEKLILPREREGWLWLNGSRRSEREQAQDALTALRQLAEGQTVRPGPSSNPWVVIGYVLGALFGLQILAVLVAIILSSFA